MAILFPDLDVIKRQNVQPTKGEWELLNFLIENLNDEYEVFFQPFLNGDCPDIILMRKGWGVLIIEVKDWNLDSYYIDSYMKWRVSHNHSVIKSPIDQVLKYKKNIYNLHIDSLLELKLRDYRYWYVVKCALFFSTTSKQNLKLFLYSNFKKQEEELKSQNAPQFKIDTLKEKVKKHEIFMSKNIALIGVDSLEKIIFEKILNDNWISRANNYFTNDLYESFKRFLKPSYHSFEDGKEFKFNKEQEELSESKVGNQKVKGVAGAGKTLVLAKRAVNAHKRTGDQVLIISFNITLKNYIHDKISNVRDDFNWRYFHIVNYHDFINSVMNNVGIEFEIPANFEAFNSFERELFFDKNYYGNLDLFNEKLNEISKYSTILVDEIQDFKTIWLRLIKKYFLKENGEFVVFGDSKQDIYNRVDLINYKKELVIPDSVGRWKELNKSYRFTPTISSFAQYFQKEFLSTKHNLDEFEDNNFQSALFDRVHYHFFGQCNLDEVTEYIATYIKKIKVHPNDICILSSLVEDIRLIDFLFRHKTKERTYIMSETKEFYDKLKLDYVNDPSKFRHEIDKIQKNKKLHFWMNSGMTKFSTVHSFKGWEINTLFLIVNKETLEVSYNEIIYTGFTRCSNNLIILNIDDEKLHDFMSNLQIVQTD